VSRSAALGFTRSGTGPTLFLLHGIGGSRTAWDAQIARLHAAYTCIAADFPGYGDSGDPIGSRLETFGEALLELIAGRAVHLIGVSFGALMALYMARHHPKVVQSLVLADATLGRAAERVEDRRRWLELRRRLAHELPTASKQRAAAIAAPGATSEVIEEIARHMRRARPVGYLAVANAIAETDARDWLAHITQPALVLCGEYDGVTGLATSEHIARVMPRAKLVVIAGAGHAPHIEQPDRFADAVLEFLPTATSLQTQATSA
jgi:3-oxoadipate enol-lactonase